MKDVSELESTQIYLYAAGQIPHKHILTRDGVEQIRNSFAFRELGSMPATGELVFEGGKLDLGRQGKVPLTRLHLGERRIIITVAGTSAAAGQVFAVLRSMISQMDPTRPFEKFAPITVKEESSCNVGLDVGWEAFFNPAFVEFVRKSVTDAISGEDASASLAHVRYRFTFNYSAKSTAIAESGISLAPKEFVVEPLANSPMSERRYLASAPTNSDALLKLVADLETSLLGATR